MKIKDVVKETTLGSVQKVDQSTGKVQIGTQGGGTQTIDASQMTTGPDGKPTIKLPQTGAQVNIQQGTQEELEDEPTSIAPTKDTGAAMNGEDIMHKLQHDPSSLTPEELQWLQHQLSGDKSMTHGDPEDGIHGETDPDLVGSGENKDVGGDATDQLIKQVTDRKWERGARQTAGNTVANSVLPESDELTKMLTIAGLK